LSEQADPPRTAERSEFRQNDPRSIRIETDFVENARLSLTESAMLI
jgi:hypothetical protein